MACRPVGTKPLFENNAGILFILLLGTHFNEMLIKIYTVSFKEMHSSMTSAKWQPFWLGLNVLSGEYNFWAHACTYIPYGPIHSKSGLKRWIVLWLRETNYDMEQLNMTDIPLWWRQNGRDGVWNYRRLHCLLDRLFRRRSKKTLKLGVSGLNEGNSPGTSLHKRPVTQKMFPFDDVIMLTLQYITALE